MPSVVKRYSDIDLNFTPNPTSGDITVLKDADSIKRAVRNLLLTNLYERPYKKNFGGNLSGLLFEPITPATREKIKVQILSTLRSFEERIEVLELTVTVNPDENGYNVRMTFSIDAISEVATVNVFLERVR